MVVVTISKLDEGGLQFLEVTKPTEPQDLFFEGAKEALDASVSFRLTYKRRGWLDSQEFDFALKVLAHIDAAVVMPQPQTVRGPGRKIPKVFLHRLADRLETVGGRFGVESPPGEGTRVWAEVDLEPG